MVKGKHQEEVLRWVFEFVRENQPVRDLTGLAGKRAVSDFLKSHGINIDPAGSSLSTVGSRSTGLKGQGYIDRIPGVGWVVGSRQEWDGLYLRPDTLSKIVKMAKQSADPLAQLVVSLDREYRRLRKQQPEVSSGELRRHAEDRQPGVFFGIQIRHRREVNLAHVIDSCLLPNGRSRPKDGDAVMLPAPVNYFESYYGTSGFLETRIELDSVAFGSRTFRLTLSEDGVFSSGAMAQYHNQTFTVRGTEQDLNFIVSGFSLRAALQDAQPILMPMFKREKITLDNSVEL